MTQDTLQSLLPPFLKSLKISNRSQSTILAYNADIGQLIVYLTNHNKATVSQIKSEEIESFRDSLLSKKYTAKTVSRKLNAVKTFFRWMENEKLIRHNPSEKVAHPKFSHNPPKFLTPIEYRALRDIVRDDSRMAAIVELILQTGMRISDISNLKISDIEKEEITITPHATQPLRKIPLNRPAKDALDEYYKIRPKTDSNHLFISRNGKPLAIRNIRAAMDRYFQKAEIPDYSINDLRSTFIVENLKAGVSISLLSSVVGHKRLSTTERYLKLAKIEKSGNKQVLEEL